MTIKDLFALTAWGQGGASVMRAAMMLLMMLLTATTAWAEFETVSFTDENGAASDDGNTYTIRNADGWNLFCDRLAAEDGKTFFSGKTVKLAADIGSAGSANHDFTGHFDGQGHTLYVRLGTPEAPLDVKAAPFQNVTTVNSIAVSIENLRVCGDIYASGMYAGGIIGSQYGDVTLRNCRSSVSIHSSATGDTSTGGLVGNGHDNLKIEGCLFDGSLTTESTGVRCAGFVGYYGSTATLSVSNSLVVPSSVTIGTGTGGTISATFARLKDGATITATNCYYVTDALGTAQGKQRRSIEAGENVTVGHAGVATTYGVSVIKAYKATETSGSSDPFIAGLVYYNVLYAGSGDAVSLTLANSATIQQGYQYGYSVSGGATLDGTTLTMAEADVTVNIERSVIDWATVSSGDSEAEAYIIYNEDQFDLLAQCVKSGTSYENKFFKLMADLDYTDKTYTPIGNDDYAFRGTFDGNDKTISHVILEDAGQYRGIFGYVGNGATVKKLTVDQSSFKGMSYIGGIAGRVENATISNCHNKSSVSSSDNAEEGFGGIAGYAENSTIDNCQNTGNVYTSGSHCVGGIVGKLLSVTVSNCQNMGQVVGMEYVGGIAGNADNSTIIGCQNSGSDSYGSTYAGGIAGYTGGGAVSYCVNKSEVNGYSNYKGGIVGYATRYNNEGTTISNCLNFGKVSSSNGGGLGGIVGYNYGAVLSSNYYSGNCTTGGVKGSDVTENDGAVPALRDNADNTTAISLMANIPESFGTYSVRLNGRTLYKDGKWNTLCLPFDVDITGSPLDGADVRTLSTASFDSTKGELTLNFTDAGAVTTIEAGKPYIIKWTKASDYEGNESAYDLTESALVFSSVTISNTTTDVTAIIDETVGQEKSIAFCGIFSPKNIGDNGDNTILYLGSENKLYYPTKARTIKSCRAYFQLYGLTAGESDPDPDDSQGTGFVRAFNLNFFDEQSGKAERGNEETTGITSTTNYTNFTNSDNAWYDLSGRKLQGKPTAKGLYIYNGKKVVIK